MGKGVLSGFCDWGGLVANVERDLLTGECCVGLQILSISKREILSETLNLLYRA
jgi:hypothetical protein